MPRQLAKRDCEVLAGAARSPTTWGPRGRARKNLPRGAMKLPKLYLLLGPRKTLEPSEKSDTLESTNLGGDARGVEIINQIRSENCFD